MELTQSCPSCGSTSCRVTKTPNGCNIVCESCGGKFNVVTHLRPQKGATVELKPKASKSGVSLKKPAKEWRCQYCNSPTERGHLYCDSWCKQQHQLELEAK